MSVLLFVEPDDDLSLQALTFARVLGEGVNGEVTETVVGANGIAVRLHVRWPHPGEGRGVNFYQAYLVTDGLITEIQRHDDRRSAVAAISP